MTLVSGGGFLPSNNLSEIIYTNLQKLVIVLTLILSMLNFYLLFNLFNRKTLFREHKEDFYLTAVAIFFIFSIYLYDLNGLNIIISIVSSLANSGISLIKSDNNLSLYFCLSLLLEAH